MTNWIEKLLQWWNQRSFKGNFYRKSLIIVLCITSLPTAVIGFTTYILGKKHIEQEVNRNQQVLLMKALDRINDDLTHLELTATQWAFDPRFDEQLRNVNLKERYDITYNLYRSLIVMKGSYPLVDQVYLFLNGSQPEVVSESEGIYSILNEDQKMRYQALLTNKKGAFWLDNFQRINPKVESSIALVHKLPGIGEPYGALIIYMDKVKLVKMVRELSPDEQGGSFILGEDGHFIIKGNTESAQPTDFESALRDEVLKRDAETDSFLLPWKNNNYSVSYGEFSRLGLHWKYVTATPLAQITKPVVLTSRIILGISLMGLIIAVVLSWLASKRLYRPIRHLVGLFQDSKPSVEAMNDEIEFIERQWNHLTRESKELQIKLEKAHPSLRVGFLLQLVQGHYYSLTEEELRMRMAAFGWSVKQKGFVFILIQITGFSYPQGKFTESDEQLVTFAAANIVQEMTKYGTEQSDVINFQDLSVGLLMTYSLTKPEDQIKSEMSQVAKDLSQTLSTLLKIHCTFCIGQLTPKIRDIPECLQSVRQAVRYRDLEEDNQILVLDELLLNGHNNVTYPFQMEKEIIHAVRMGLREDSSRLVQQFIDELAQRSGKEKLVQEGVLQLLGSIQHAILESGYHPLYLYDGRNLYEQLYQIREPDKMAKWFQNKVIKPFMDKLTGDQDLQMKRLMQKVTQYLKLHYVEEISLEQCADVFGTSQYTLSKAFKHITGVNFIDYITQLRIERTKELLHDPSLKINDIAKRIGYQPSYLIRVFKKYEGITPGQYREKLQTAEK